MRPDQERVRNLLTDTVTLLCKNGLQYQKELRVQGLLGITLDDTDVFVVHINEKFGDLIGGAISVRADNSDAEKIMPVTSIDIGSGGGAEHGGGKTPKVHNSKQRRRSADSSNLPARSKEGSEYVVHTASKRSLSSMQSSHFERHSNVGEVSDTAGLMQPDSDMRIKRERDVSAGENTQVLLPHCAMTVEPSTSVTHPDSMHGEVHSSYDKYNEPVSYGDASDNWSGDGPSSKRHVSQVSRYSDRNRTEADFSKRGSGFGDEYSSSRQRSEFDAQAPATDSLHSFPYSYMDDQQQDSAQVCSTWEVPQPAATSAQAASGMESSTETGVDGYPRSHLDSPVIRDVAVSHLLEPVLSSGDWITALRVIWRLNGEQNENAWRSIIRLRQLTDEVVQVVGNVQLFVSAITGVYTRTYHSAKPMVIYPAICYWIVHDGALDRRVLFARLEQGDERPAAQVKLLNASSRLDTSGPNKFRAPLFIVLKDHNGGYIRRRMEESMRYLELSGDASVSLPLKIVVENRTRYAQRMMETQRLLANVGLRMQLNINDTVT